MSSSMFELLMGLPLFRGVSRQRLAQVVGAAKFHFLKFPDGETIIRAGENSDHLTFVIGGKVRVAVTNNSGRFAMLSTMEAPAVVSPDFLFGRMTHYPCTVTAIDNVNILKISKADFVKILYSDQVFMFNYLNTLSVNAQKCVLGLLSLTEGGLDERIAYWVIALTQPGAVDISLTCKARDLCTLFNVPRANFDSTMRIMEDRGLIEYTSKTISIKDRRAMLALLEKATETHEDFPAE